MGARASAILAVMDVAHAADEELMLRFQCGDPAAFDTLYARHKGALFRYFLRQCEGRGTAEELAQDVWLKLIRARGTYVNTAKFATYIYTLAHHRLIDHYRAQGRATILSADDEHTGELVAGIAAADSVNPQSQLESRTQALRVNAAIAALPMTQREAFLLQQESGLSVEQIAQMTGVTFETAKSRLRYALAKLRVELKDLL